jgi:hypothetical protein
MAAPALLVDAPPFLHARDGGKAGRKARVRVWVCVLSV